ncbi:MAG TPA: hemerythrin domain-containing protein [Pseudonocardiaceae bacterium]
MTDSPPHHEEGRPEDLITLLTADHRRVEALFERLGQLAGGTGREAKVVAEQVVIELVRHSVAEELHLYPVVRARVPDGDRIAEHELAEHLDAERTMAELEGMNPEHEEFWPTVHRLMRQIRQHVQEEENELFPQLRSVCTTEELVELGRKAALAKTIAPTRPHPAAPHTPPGNLVLGPMMGVLDRARDIVSGRGRR